MTGPLARLLSAPTEGQSAYRTHCADHDGDVAAFVERLGRDPVVVDDVVTGSPLGHGEWPPSYLSWLTRRGSRSMRMTVDFSSCLYIRTHTPGAAWSLGEKPTSTRWASSQILGGERLVGSSGLWPTVFPSLGISHTGPGGCHRALAMKMLGAEAELDANLVDTPADDLMYDVLKFWEAIDGEVTCDASCEAARGLYEELSEGERAALRARPELERSMRPMEEDARVHRQFRRIAARRAVRGQPIGRLLAPHCPRHRDDPDLLEWANGGPRSVVEWMRAFRRGVLL